MKRTFYYNFFPTKAEEEKAKKARGNGEKQVISRVLIEIREEVPQIENRELPPKPPLTIKPKSFCNWHIKKVVRKIEIATGTLVLSFRDTLDHVFQYWAMDKVNFILKGNKLLVKVWDVSDGKGIRIYENDNTYLKLMEEGPNDRDEYCAFGLMDLVRDRSLKKGDQIGLTWDARFSGFVQFKLLSRANVAKGAEVMGQRMQSS